MAEERPSSPVGLSSPASSTIPAPSSPPLVPKKKAIRLPFHVSYLPNDAVAKTQRLCGMCVSSSQLKAETAWPCPCHRLNLSCPFCSFSCRQNTSPYACPRCQIPYCSLACYQNTSKHSQCSEPFYKAEIELDIASSQGKDGKGGGKTREEKDKMMGMLKRFEEGVGSEEPLEWDEEEGKEGVGEEQADGLDELAELLESAGLGTFSLPSCCSPLLELTVRACRCSNQMVFLRKSFWPCFLQTSAPNSCHPSPTPPRNRHPSSKRCSSRTS